MLRHHAPTALFAVTVLLVLTSCSTKPDEPTFDNPFDPNGTGGDPYDLRAEVGAEGVELIWTDNDAVVAWTVFHSTTSPNDLSALGELTIERDADAGQASALHADYSPAQTNWYRVQGQLGSGELLPLSLGAAAQVSPPPLVRRASGAVATTGTRFIQLELRTDVGDAIELSNDADFGGAQAEPTVPGEVKTIDWTLPPVDADGARLAVHYRNVVGGSVGIVDSLELTVRFSPSLSLTSGVRLGETALLVVDTTVTVAATGEGVTRARLAFEEAGLSSAVWDDTPESIGWNIPLSVVEPDTLFAEVESDFGFGETSILTYTPATAVGPASLSVVDDLETTAADSVALVNVAEGAAEMILSEDPGFADATWTAFADTVMFGLSDGAGEKIIFGRYRNAWDPEGSSDLTRIIRLSEP